MENRVMKQKHASDRPELGYQCLECGKYFDDSYYSKPIRQFDSLHCPHKCIKCHCKCGTLMEVVDTEKKIVCRYVNSKS